MGGDALTRRRVGNCYLPYSFRHALPVLRRSPTALWWGSKRAPAARMGVAPPEREGGLVIVICRFLFANALPVLRRFPAALWRGSKRAPAARMRGALLVFAAVLVINSLPLRRDSNPPSRRYGRRFASRGDFYLPTIDKENATLYRMSVALRIVSSF